MFHWRKQMFIEMNLNSNIKLQIAFANRIISFVDIFMLLFYQLLFRIENGWFVEMFLVEICKCK